MLLKEFSTIFDRPEKVKKLREYILSLAVRGKLVEQDENDEPASVLLEKIREEKDRLVKEKKIKKKDIEFPNIEISELQFELPLGWEFIRLGEFIRFIGGSQPPKSTFKYEHIEGYIRLVQIRDYKSDANITYIPIEKAKRFCNKHEIMIGRYGPPIFQILRGIEGAYNVALMKADPIAGISYDYLYYLLKDPILLLNLESLASRTCGQDGIDMNYLKSYIVGLPPLNEQKRIVEKLDYLMKFCDKLEEQLEKQVKYGTLSAKSVLNGVSNCSSYEELEEALRFIIENFKDLTLADGAVGELKNAILSLAVKGKLVPQDKCDEPANVLVERIKEEKDRLVKEKKIKKEKPLPEISKDEIAYELPKDWEWVRLGEISTILRGSSPRPKGDPRFFTDERTEYNWITIWDITNKSDGRYLIDTREFLTEEGSKKSTYVEKGEIIIAVSGSVGKSTVLGIDGYIYDGLAVIKNLENSNLRDYMYLYLQAILTNINNMSEGTSMPNINTQVLKELIIPLPPLNEQKRIVEKVDKLMKVCDELELRIEKSKKYNEKLMDSILKNSFKA